MKVKFFYPYPLDIDIDTDKNVEVYIDTVNLNPIPLHSIRIVIIEEPLKGPFYQLMKERTDLYTHLLTFHDEILTTNSKARLFHCTNTWVAGYDPEQKYLSVSFIVGGKNNPAMEGYRLRHDIWRNKDRITVPKAFYLSGNAITSHGFVHWPEADYEQSLVLGASKTPLFDSGFHIAIENTSIKNYFTEKIIDCFQTRTVPIYYGCINIGDYFDINGILVVNNVEEMVAICNQITSEMYINMLPAMEENYYRSMAWVDHDEQIRNAIIKLI